MKYWKVSINMYINHDKIFAVLIFSIQIYRQIPVKGSSTIVQAIIFHIIPTEKFWAVEMFLELSVDLSGEYLNMFQ